jgi:hypothetical protein
VHIIALKVLSSPSKNESMSTIPDIIARYHSKETETANKLSIATKRIYRVGTLRLVLFILAVAGFIYFYHHLAMAILVACAFLIPFFLLIKLHGRMFERKDYVEKLLEVNRQELKAVGYDPSDFDAGKDFIDPVHSFSYDIDVFGLKSLFQYANRTVTPSGRKMLAHFFCHPFDTKADIERRQATVRELAGKFDFRQAFRTSGLLYQGSEADEKEMTQWNSTPNYFESRAYYQYLRWTIPAVNVALFVMAFFGLFSYTLPCVVVFVFMILSTTLTQHISKEQSSFDKKLHILRVYAALFSLMEKETFVGAELKDLQGRSVTDGVRASQAIRRLTRRMNALDQRNNIFVTAVLNGLFFWELHQIIRVEAWKDVYGSYLPKWMDCLAEMDALCSLGTYAYNNPDFVYPSIATSLIYRAKNMRHPLMERRVCVPNDIDMEGAPRFDIITGANMAGKSTYLRTVGVNHLLACMGLPADAEEMELYPSHLVTSLRTDDSLRDNESYFYAELKRLKMIIDKLHGGERLFVILDEILRGTNSADKQLGSYSFVRQLVKGGTTGLIATHDLQLARLRDDFPAYIDTLCFEADIKDNDLSFSYKLRDGIARNMNACFLMRKMGIEVSEREKLEGKE